MADLFEVVVGVFVKKRIEGISKYLIVKRSPGVKSFPNMWVPPGGHLDLADFVDRPKDAGNCWANPLTLAINREIMEETGLTIGPPTYVMNRVFVKNGGWLDDVLTPVIIFSFTAPYVDGDVTLKMDEVCDYRWVTWDEARSYPMIDGVIDELAVALDQDNRAFIPQLHTNWYR